MSTEYCDNCGSTLDPGAKFCSECGEPVDGGDDGWGDPTGSAARPEPTAAQPTGDQTTFAALTHVLALLTWVIGPLIVFVVAEDEFVVENARNALNWQIIFTVYMLVSFVLVFVLVGFVLLMILPVLDLVLCVLAAVKASEGEAWEYPATPRIV